MNEAQSLPWVEKYRPTAFYDIVSQNNILTGLKKSIDMGNFQNCIFYGPSGSGKTTTIMACSRYMYGDNCVGMKIDLNASDDRGILTIREQVKTFASSTQIVYDTSLSKVSTKLVILDEADQLTDDAQSALKKIIEQYAHNTRFCLICNNIDKISKEIKSRCMAFPFSPIPVKLHVEKLKYICDKENLMITDKGLKIIAQRSEGDMRKSINILQSLHVSNQGAANDTVTLNEDDVLRRLGYPLTSDINNMLSIILDKGNDIKKCVNLIEQMKHDFGLNTTDLLKDIAEHIISSKHEKMVNVISKLGNIENYLASSHNDSLLLALIIGTIKE
jgi:replication factor C subunit 3/5